MLLRFLREPQVSRQSGTALQRYTTISPMAEKGGDVAVLGPAFENSDGKASDEAQIGEVGDLYDARGDKSKYGDVKRG